MTEKEKILKSTFITQTQGYLDISKRIEIWKNICSKFNGKLDIKHTKTSEIQTLKLIIQHNKWELKFTESDTKPLKIEINFKKLVDYKLVIGQEEILDKIMKFFGAKEIEISNKEFDNKYFIKSNNESITLKILTPEVADKILNCNIYSLSYTSDSNESSSNLVAVIHRNVDTENAFTAIINLFIGIVDNLRANRVIE